MTTKISTIDETDLDNEAPETYNDADDNEIANSQSEHLDTSNVNDYPTSEQK
jgi:hypothetical protein